MTKAPPDRRGLTRSPIPALCAQLAGHTGGMDDEVVFMVRGKTRAICQRYLDLVCTLIGAEQASRPSDSTGRGWVARAIIRPTAEDNPQT